MPKESILIIKGKESFYFGVPYEKKKNAGCGDHLHLSIQDLVSATRPLARLS
jgi:hypothetical protein